MTASANKTKNSAPSEELNETGRRKRPDRRQTNQPVATERREVQRRRQIDPTTCERDYTDEEIEFMQALDAYKRASGRMFPTCSEILEVLRDMGYQRVRDGEPLVAPGADSATRLVESFEGEEMAERAQQEIAALDADE